MIKWLRKRTLKKKIISVLIITIIPIFICMFFTSVISIQTIRKQIYATSFDTLSLHKNQIDKELNSTADYVRSIDSNENYISDFQSKDRTKNYYASNYYIRTISPMVSMLDYAEGILIYSPKNGALIYDYNSNNNNFTKRQLVMNYMKHNIDNLKRNKWSYYKIGDQYVLIYLYRIRDTYFGAWTYVDNLLDVTSEWKIAQNGTIYITTDTNKIMAESGEGANNVDLSGDIKSYYFSKEYLVLGVVSEEGDFKIMEAVDVQYLTWPYERIFYVAVGIIILFLLLIPVVLRTLNRSIFHPMGKMQIAIAAIDQGELNYQIEPMDENVEFQHLTEAFNSMVRQIENLRIETYEDKIEQDRIMMQYLQLQIEPHFYLNALNTISAMAQVGDTDLIIKLSKNLSEYLRFITKTKNGTVTVKEELNHIKNYMEIIEIRLGNNFTYTVNIDEEVVKFEIPPLIIQNLVENVMKYAFNIYQNTEISITIRKKLRDGVQGILICVEDNGNGYPEEVIWSFDKEEENDNRIGLQNTRKRLRYFYGDRSSFYISNRVEGGARAEIWILFHQGGDAQT